MSKSVCFYGITSQRWEYILFQAVILHARFTVKALWALFCASSLTLRSHPAFPYQSGTQIAPVSSPYALALPCRYCMPTQPQINASMTSS